MSEEKSKSMIDSSWIYIGHFLHRIAPQLFVLLIKEFDDTLSISHKKTIDKSFFS